MATKKSALDELEFNQWRQRQRELSRMPTVRSLITLLLIGLLAAVLAFGAATCFFPTAWTNAKDFMSIALPAVTGLLGSAIGFYFASSPKLSPEVEDDAANTSLDKSQLGPDDTSRKL